MDKEYIVILYDGVPLVVVKYDPLRIVPEMLNQYAKDYAFDRRKLRYAIVPLIELPLKSQTIEV